MSFLTLQRAQLQVKVGELYYHHAYPKMYYRVNQVAFNAYNHRIMVIYTSCNHQPVTWTQPLACWLELVNGVPGNTKFKLKE